MSVLGLFRMFFNLPHQGSTILVMCQYPTCDHWHFMPWLIFLVFISRCWCHANIIVHPHSLLISMIISSVAECGQILTHLWNFNSETHKLYCMWWLCLMELHIIHQWDAIFVKNARSKTQNITIWGFKGFNTRCADYNLVFNKQSADVHAHTHSSAGIRSSSSSSDLLKVSHSFARSSVFGRTVETQGRPCNESCKLSSWF